jgi:5-methyltetrahydropteroyltriglutamate--homocysteine methyltransferase
MGTGYHAEHVGSLLRPRWLLEARAASKRGERSASELRDAEDRAAAEVIELQREAGQRVFTDGEVRRTNWMDGLLSSIGGLVPVGRA